MKFRKNKFGVALAAFCLLTSQAHAGSQPQATDPEIHTISNQLEDGSTYLNIDLLKTSCDPNKNAALGVGVILDIGLALFGKVLEKRQEGLTATYAGSKTARTSAAVQCIKIERKEKLSGEDKTLMTAELEVERYEGLTSASRLVLKKLDVTTPAPKRSKVSAKTRLNYAISISFLTVDSAGKERSFSRNLPLVRNVPLTGSLPKSDKPSVVKVSTKKNEEIATSTFASLPVDMVATVTVSITETDSKFSKAEKISDFFEENMSVIDTALGDIFD